MPPARVRLCFILRKISTGQLFDGAADSAVKIPPVSLAAPRRCERVISSHIDVLSSLVVALTLALTLLRVNTAVYLAVRAFPYDFPRLHPPLGVLFALNRVDEPVPAVPPLAQRAQGCLRAVDAPAFRGCGIVDPHRVSSRSSSRQRTPRLASVAERVLDWIITDTRR